MSKPRISGDGGQNRPCRAGKILRAAEWFLLTVAVLGAAVVGLSAARSLWPTDDESRQRAKRETRRESPQEIQTLAAAEPSHPDAKAVPPKPAATTAGPTYVPPATVEALKEEALEVVGGLLNGFPGTVGPIALMGIAHQKLGKSAEALKCWKTCVQLDPNCVGAYCGMAQLAARTGESQRAVALWRKVLELDPAKPRVREHLGDALLSLGRPDEAIAALEEEIEFGPKAGHSHFLLGQAYRQLGAYEKAKTCYEAALRIHPNLAEAYFGLFTVCARLGQREQAEQYREKFQELRAQIVEADSDQQEAYDDLLVMRQRVGHIFTDVGRYYGAQGDMPKAEDLWRRAAILDPKNARCRRQLTALYETVNRDREALQVYEELCGIEPENVLFYAHVGVLNTRLKRLDAAEKAFRKMIQIAPQRPEGYSGLAQLHVRRNANVREAKTCAARAVELAPTAKNYSILGIVCQKGGDRPGALAAWKRAVELDPENVEYASVYEQIQQKQ